MKNCILKLSSALLLFLSMITQVNAQDIEGSWKGTLSVQGNGNAFNF